MPYGSWDIKIPLSIVSSQPATHPLDIAVFYSRSHNAEYFTINAILLVTLDPTDAKQKWSCRS